MDKSKIYFSNGKKIAGKRSMECKQNNIPFAQIGKPRVNPLLSLNTSKSLMKEVLK
jgi:hypothetical protein